jgi:hypothetical protein
MEATKCPWRRSRGLESTRWHCSKSSGSTRRSVSACRRSGWSEAWGKGARLRVVPDRHAEMPARLRHGLRQGSRGNVVERMDETVVKQAAPNGAGCHRGQPRSGRGAPVSTSAGLSEPADLRAIEPASQGGHRGVGTVGPGGSGSRSMARRWPRSVHRRSRRRDGGPGSAATGTAWDLARTLARTR